MVGVEFASPAMEGTDIAATATVPPNMASRVSAKCLEDNMLLLTASIYQVRHDVD